MLRTTLALLAFYALTAPASAPAGAIDGSYTVDGKALPLVDVIATPDFIAGTNVFVATQPFDRDRLFKDGKLDTHRLRIDTVGKAFVYLEFQVRDGKVDCVKAYDTIPYQRLCEGLVATLTADSATQVAGTLKIASGQRTLEFRFDAAVEGKR